jgi:hypothetical protein
MGARMEISYVFGWIDGFDKAEYQTISSVAATVITPNSLSGMWRIVR